MKVEPAHFHENVSLFSQLRFCMMGMCSFYLIVLRRIKLLSTQVSAHDFLVVQNIFVSQIKTTLLKVCVGSHRTSVRYELLSFSVCSVHMTFESVSIDWYWSRGFWSVHLNDSYFQTITFGVRSLVDMGFFKEEQSLRVLHWRKNSGKERWTTEEHTQEKKPESQNVSVWLPWCSPCKIVSLGKTEKNGVKIVRFIPDKMWPETKLRRWKSDNFFFMSRQQTQAQHFKKKHSTLIHRKMFDLTLFDDPDCVFQNQDRSSCQKLHWSKLTLKLWSETFFAHSLQSCKFKWTINWFLRWKEKRKEKVQTEDRECELIQEKCAKKKLVKLVLPFDTWSREKISKVCMAFSASHWLHLEKFRSPCYFFFCFLWIFLVSCQRLEGLKLFQRKWVRIIFVWGDSDAHLIRPPLMHHHTPWKFTENNVSKSVHPAYAVETSMSQTAAGNNSLTKCVNNSIPPSCRRRFCVGKWENWH